MCNFYSVTKSQQAPRELVKAMRDLTDNVPPLRAPMEEALLLQKPPPGGALKVVAVDTKQDAVS